MVLDFAIQNIFIVYCLFSFAYKSGSVWTENTKIGKISI